MLLYVKALVCLFVFISKAATADVMDKSEQGFHIKIELELNAPHRKAYRQFLKVDEWWDENHSWFGDAKGFYIEPQAGGCFCEKSGKKSVLHMLVSYVDPGNEIKMLGGLGPLQGMGLHGAMSFRFEPISQDKTRLIHEYRVMGYSKDGLQNLAGVVDSVQTAQVRRLQAQFQ